MHLICNPVIDILQTLAHIWFQISNARFVPQIVASVSIALAGGESVDVTIYQLHSRRAVELWRSQLQTLNTNNGLLEY